MSDYPSGFDRFWDVAMKLTVIGVTAVSGMALNHEIRLSRMEESRFTSADAAAMEKRMGETSVPEWLRDIMQSDRRLLETMDARLRVIESTVIRLNTLHELQKDE